MSLNVSNYIERMIRDGITPEAIRKVQREVCNGYDKGLFDNEDWNEFEDSGDIRLSDSWLRNTGIDADEAPAKVQRVAYPSAAKRQRLREFRESLTFQEKIYATLDDNDEYHEIAMTPIDEMILAAELDTDGISQR